MFTNQLFHQKLQLRWTGKQHPTIQPLTQDEQASQKTAKPFLPTNIGVFSLVENQVTFKLENVFFFTVNFARVGFGKSASQR
jgi:hypothetical protein